MQLGRYQILQQLASGSVADVMLARASGLEGFARHVVIKCMRPEHASEERFAKAFLEEARIAGALNHQNIVQVHDVGEQDGAYFFAMEYVHGEDARKLINKVHERGEHIPLEHALSIVMATAAGLHHAHEKTSPSGEKLGIVHRDVSPANILIGYDGSVKIVDFGMAKAVARSTTTSTGALKGKSSYMSPEQCTGRSVDRRTDIFALGIVLFELITAQRLFKGINEFMTMAAIVEGQIPRPSTLRREVPAALDEIVLRALERSPESRYQTAEAFRDSLEAFAVAHELRTSHKSLADYLAGLFGARAEPWEARAASQPISMDPEATLAKGIVPAPDVKPGELLARFAPRAESPMALADGAGEWGEDDEQIATAASGARALARSRTRSDADSSQPLTLTDMPPASDTQQVPRAPADTTESPQPDPADTVQLPTSRGSAGDETRASRPLANTVPRVRPTRPTGGDEIDSRTVVQPPIFGSGPSGNAHDDEFESEQATELAADDDPPWKQHEEKPTGLGGDTITEPSTKPPVGGVNDTLTELPRGAKGMPASLRSPPPAPVAPAAAPPTLRMSSSGFASPSPPPSATPPPPLRGTSSGFASPSPPPSATPPPPLRAASAGFASPSPPSPVGPPASLPPPSHVSPPTALGFGAAPAAFSASPAEPGFAPYAGAVPGGAGVQGLTQGVATTPAVDLRGGLRVFVDKHRMALLASGLTFLLVGVLAARGCDDPPRQESPAAGSAND